MLGWALMETRRALRGGASDLVFPQGAAYSSVRQESSQLQVAASSSVGKEFQGTAPAQASGAELAPSILTGVEKSFLKVAKKVRELIKLEAAVASGKPFDKLQAKKLEGKHDLLLELSSLANDLSPELQAKNNDVLIAARDYLADASNS